MQEIYFRKLPARTHELGYVKKKHVRVFWTKDWAISTGNAVLELKYMQCFLIIC